MDTFLPVCRFLLSGKESWGFSAMPGTLQLPASPCPLRYVTPGCLLSVTVPFTTQIAARSTVSQAVCGAVSLGGIRLLLT